MEGTRHLAERCRSLLRIRVWQLSKDLRRRQPLLLEQSMLHHLASAKRVRPDVLIVLRAHPNSRGTTRDLHSSSLPFTQLSYQRKSQISRSLIARPACNED